MGGFNHNFCRYVHLPTNWLDYSPSCWVNNVTSEFLLAKSDDSLSNSYLEFIVSIIKKQTQININIEDLYLIDLYYLWLSIYVYDIEGKDRIIEIHRCSNKKCKKENKTSIHVGLLKNRIYNPYRYDKNLFNKKIININGYEVCIRLRTVNDSFVFSNLALASKNKLIKLYCLFLTTQTEYIKDTNGSIIDKNNYEGFYSSLSIQKLLKTFNEVNTFNHFLGMENNLRYKCSCGQINFLQLFNDIATSMISPTTSARSEYNKEEFYRIHLQAVQYGHLSLEQLVSIPLKDSDIYSRALSRIEMVPKNVGGFF